MRSTGDIGRRFCLIVIALCGFTAFLIGIYFVGSQCYKVISYHPTPATIREWRLEHVADGYRLVVRYDYTVDGDDRFQ